MCRSFDVGRGRFESLNPRKVQEQRARWHFFCVESGGRMGRGTLKVVRSIGDPGVA